MLDAGAGFPAPAERWVVWWAVAGVSHELSRKKPITAHTSYLSRRRSVNAIAAGRVSTAWSNVSRQATASRITTRM